MEKKPLLEPGEMTDEELEYVAGGISPQAQKLLAQLGIQTPQQSTKPITH